jgi:uncharacterized protein (DUF2141 family)
VCITTVAFSQGEIHIDIAKISSDTGQIILLLFKPDQPYGIDKDPYRKIILNNFSEGKCSITIDSVEKGEYAFIVFHDADKNGDLLTNFMGMPKEGIGNSGTKNARPNYENTKFTFNGLSRTFNIELKYL